MKKHMTVRSLKIACDKFPYILVRYPDGYQTGINTKIAKIALKKNKYKDDKETKYVSFMPCDLNTYISKKHPFIGS